MLGHKRCPFVPGGDGGDEGGGFGGGDGDSDGASLWDLASGLFGGGND